MDVQALGGGGAELLQDAAHRLRHVVGHHPGELQLAVDDHAALPEVQDLQVLESRQVGLQVRQQLRTAGGKQSVSQPAQELSAGCCSAGRGLKQPKRLFGPSVCEGSGLFGRKRS